VVLSGDLQGSWTEVQSVLGIELGSHACPFSCTGLFGELTVR
jgi:hypothetical protein